MYAILCPHCQAVNSVVPAKAGDSIRCSACNHSIAVPKLGELRNLPLIHDAAPTAKPASGTGPSRSVAYAGLCVLAAGLLLFSAYCGIRWALIETPISTEGHLAELRVRYHEVSSAQLVREWEDITKYGIDLPVPYRYRKIELVKQSWARNGMIFAAAGLASIGAAALASRRSTTA